MTLTNSIWAQLVSKLVGFKREEFNEQSHGHVIVRRSDATVQKVTTNDVTD